MADKPDIVLVVDTREQRPYAFVTPCEVGTLQAGDYSVKGYEARVAVERKSMEDLLGTMTVGRERFTRELERAAGMGFFAVVVEGTWGDLAAGRYRSKMSPASATGTVLSWTVRYRVPFLFVGTRDEGARVTERLLLAWWKEFLLTGGVKRE